MSSEFCCLQANAAQLVAGKIRPSLLTVSLSMSMALAVRDLPPTVDVDNSLQMLHASTYKGKEEYLYSAFWPR